MKDGNVKKLIAKEKKRQEDSINLIASENIVSKDVLEALGSVFTNKYAEGYPRKRYYGGNAIIDELEELAISRALNLFHLSPETWNVNVQPYSGSPANLAVLHALIPLGKKVMAMDLAMGGHLSHGSRVSVTGTLWKQVPYGVDKKTGRVDYNNLFKIAKKERPSVIIAGGSSYARIIDFKKFRKVADSVGAILIVDMSHVSGLVAGGVYPTPFPYADVVMTTTHKTLRGPRGAIVFSKKELSEKINKVVFPGIQGGPHENQIAAIAVALFEASKPSFKLYARRVVKNAKVLSEELKKLGWEIVSGGTDTHLFLLDTYARGISGKKAADALEKKGIVVNKNLIPYDTRSPLDPSGIRIGTAAVTTKGMREKDMKRIAKNIDLVLKELS